MMTTQTTPPPATSAWNAGPEAVRFYRQVLNVLTEAGIPYLVGGAYALAHYTGIHRDTKDFDIFLTRRDVERALDTLSSVGYSTEMTHAHFLGKVFSEGLFVDLIFSSGNGLSPVDDEWFRYASAGELLGLPVKFCAIEDMLWSKAFIMERERYDGGDVAHLIRVGSPHLNWRRLFAHFGPHWRVLLAHLVLFGFIYPGERDRIPTRVMDTLLDRLLQEGATIVDSDVCQGTLLSRQQYLYDLDVLGMKDARRRPEGSMTAEEIERWTKGIDDASAAHP
jgi:hypothetical protein